MSKRNTPKTGSDFLSPHQFFLLAIKQRHFWDLALNGQVHHRFYGEGTVAAILPPDGGLGASTTPLLRVQFASKVADISGDSLQDDLVITQISLRPHSDSSTSSELLRQLLATLEAQQEAATRLRQEQREASARRERERAERERAALALAAREVEFHKLATSYEVSCIDEPLDGAIHRILFKLEEGLLLDAFEQRRLEAKRQEARFRRLLIQYAVEETDEKPVGRLHLLLDNLSTGGHLTDVDIAWLEEGQLFGPIAAYFERQFNAGDPWAVTKASKYWRASDRPERSVSLTSRALDTKYVRDRKLLAAVLTTRAAALCDLGDLEEARRTGQGIGCRGISLSA